jgi:RNA polymerase sigma factor (sigma-70 family)
MDSGDEELMAQVQRGEAQGFDALCERYSGPLYSFVLRLLQDRAGAAEVHQETSMRVLVEARNYDFRYRCSTWLFAIAHRLGIDWLRHRNRHLPVEGLVQTLAAVDQEPLARLIEEEASAGAHQALVLLSPEQRAAVLLRVVHVYGEKEECRAAFVWLVVLEMVFALVLGVSALMGYSLPIVFPVPRAVIYLAAALNLLALLLSPIIVVPRRERRAT